MKGSYLILLVAFSLGVIFIGILYHQTKLLAVAIDDAREQPHMLFRQQRAIGRPNKATSTSTSKSKAKSNAIPKSKDVAEKKVHTEKTKKNTSTILTTPHVASTMLYQSTFGHLEEVQGMSSCLFIMDDTIRLLEWLAYHYTVLPLRYLIVGIDPHSQHPERIHQVLDRWRPYMNITVWDNPETYLSHVPWDKAWKRKYWISPGVINPFYINKTSRAYKSQEHKRRQNIFTTYCYREHFASGRTWVINLDTDEYLIPNYFGANENTNSSSFVIHYIGTDEKLERDRKKAMDVRERLPDLSKRVTISEILHQTALDRCLKIPSLNFTSQRGARAYQGSSTYRTNTSTTLLITLMQTKTGPREGRTTKAILDVSRGSLAYLTWEKFVNVHNPNKRMCGWNGVIGSGTDYISSVFRYHHYVAGSLETSLERMQDYRVRQSGQQLQEHFEGRNFEPIPEENPDILPWLEWFLDAIGGAAAATELLFAPLEEGYVRMRSLLAKEEANRAP